MSDDLPTPPDRKRGPMTPEEWVLFFSELQLIQMRQEERRLGLVGTEKPKIEE
jgi:hypothetical protein